MAPRWCCTATRWKKPAPTPTLADTQGLTFVHPYDDEAVAAGQGTLGLEMLQAVPDLDTLVIAVGGGGLIRAWPRPPRSSRASRSWACRLRAFRPWSTPSGQHHPQGIDHRRGHCRGHAGQDHAPEIVKRLVDDLVLVDEGDIEQAVLMLLEIEKPWSKARAPRAGGAAALPRTLQGQARGPGAVRRQHRPAAAGAIIERGMVRSGRLARIKVSARDVPGVLARITATVADAGANIEEVHHQRAFTMLAAQNVEIELVLQTRGKTHVDEVLASCAADGSRPDHVSATRPRVLQPRAQNR